MRELTEAEKRELRELGSDLAQSQLSDEKREELRKQLGEYYHQRAKRRADEAARREERENKTKWFSWILDLLDAISGWWG